MLFRSINVGICKALELAKENDFILLLNDDLILGEYYLRKDRKSVV